MDDTISRQAVLDALDEISREVDDGYGFDYAKWREYFCDLPSAKFATDTNVGTKLGTNLAEVGTDCISREQAIDALEKWLHGLFGITEADGTATIFKTIRRLPPIQPKRGRWIKLDMHRGMADHKCTACKQECYVPTCMEEPMYAFCPNCGAKMEVTT